MKWELGQSAPAGEGGEETVFTLSPAGHDNDPAFSEATGGSLTENRPGSFSLSPGRFPVFDFC